MALSLEKTDEINNRMLLFFQAYFINGRCFDFKTIDIIKLHARVNDIRIQTY